MKDFRLNILNKDEFENFLKNLKLINEGEIRDDLIDEYEKELNFRQELIKTEYIKSLPINLQFKLERKFYHNYGYKKNIVLDINTSDKTRNKAYRTLYNFMEWIRELGGYVSVDKIAADDNTMISLLHSRYRCKIYEKQIKLRNKSNEKNFKSMKPLYELEYTGELYFEVYSERLESKEKDKWQLIHSISFDKLGGIEKKFKELFLKLREDAISKKVIEDEKWSKHQAKWEEEQKRDEEERILKAEAEIEREKLEKKKQLQEQINTQIKNWKYIKYAEEYVEELLSDKSFNEKDKKVIIDYCNYVKSVYNKAEFYNGILEFMINIYQ